MHAELEDWKNGWYGVELGLTADEIETLIARLRMLQAEPDQHFHLSSTYRGDGGLGDILIYVQDTSEPGNMEPIGGKALGPGETLPTRGDTGDPAPGATRE